jgi:hypothetical protein
MKSLNNFATSLIEVEKIKWNSDKNDDLIYKSYLLAKGWLNQIMNLNLKVKQ